MEKAKMIDQNNKNATRSNEQSVRDLRYILTQSCNYTCGFCHKERMNGDEKECFDAKDYAFIYQTAKHAIPIKGVTFSGGEPLMRKDTLQIAEELKKHQAPITMVTNGALLNKRQEIIPLLDRLNVSLHSTNQEIYNAITGSKTPVQHIMQHIILIKEKYPDLDLRINATLVQHLQPQIEIDKMIEFVSVHDLTLKYIELTPITAPGYIPINSLIPTIEKYGFIQIADEKQQAVYAKEKSKIMLRKCSCELAQQLGTDQEFCKKNNDINISPDGIISSCLCDPKKIGIYDQVKSRNTEGLISNLQKSSDIETKYPCPY